MESLELKLRERIRILEEAIQDSYGCRFQFVERWKGELRAYKTVLKDITKK